jgi:hypothetical protein
MNGDQQYDNDSDDNDNEEGWPAEDDNDKGPMGRHGGQATRGTATTTRGGHRPSCFFFIHFFFFLFFSFTKIYSIEIYYDINKDDNEDNEDMKKTTTTT